MKKVISVVVVILLVTISGVSIAKAGEKMMEKAHMMGSGFCILILSTKM
jgi:hypothetical protein